MFPEMNEELFEGSGKDTFHKHSELMKMLLDKRVFSVEGDSKEGFYLVEGCDQYFAIRLTNETCLKLSAFFKDLGKYIK